MFIVDDILNWMLNRSNMHESWDNETANMRLQQQYFEQNRDNEREYQLPVNQVQRFIDAGLNPNLMTGQLSNGTISPQSPTPSASPFARVSKSDIGQDLINIQTLDLLKQQQSESESRERLNDANTRRTNVNTTWESIKSALDAMKKDAFEDYGYYKELVMNLINENVGQVLTNQHQELKNTLFEETFSDQVKQEMLQTDNMAKDLELKDSEINLNRSDIKKNNSDIALNGSLMQLNAKKSVYYEKLGEKIQEEIKFAKQTAPERHQIMIMQLENLYQAWNKLKSEVDKNESRTELNETIRQLKYLEFMMNTITKGFNLSQSPFSTSETEEFDGDGVLQSYKKTKKH